MIIVLEEQVSSIELTEQVVTVYEVADFGLDVTEHHHTSSSDGGTLGPSLTLVTPVVADLSSMNHNHSNAAGGGAVVSSSITVAGVVELATDAEALTGTDTARATTPANIAAIFATLPDGTMRNLKINVTVVSNDLVLALKTHAGTDPSATDPGYIKINGTVRSVTAATSCTLADATNWFSSGSSELAAKEIDYFAYAVWDSNSSIVAVAPARFPTARLVSDFSATSTNEKFIGNQSNYTSTDDVCVIGRFAATLSAAAGHTWTVPTFTNKNLIQHPIYETRLLDWTPTHSRTGTNYTNLPTTNNAQYQVIMNRVLFYEKHTQNATPGGTNFQRFTLPWSNVFALAFTGIGNNATAATVFTAFINASTNTCDLYKYDGTSEATGSNIYTVFNGQFYITT